MSPVVARAKQDPAQLFEDVLAAAVRFPGVRIDRETFLRTALSRHCSQEVVERTIRETPARAGVPAAIIRRSADAVIKLETGRVTALSTAAGIPGGLAMLGTVPADMAQNLAHMLRVAQKLAYLYGWPDLFTDGESMDDETMGMLVLFVGVMFGVTQANAGVAKVAKVGAKAVAKELPKQALTKTLVYPIVKRVAASLGVKMNKQVFANGVAKVVPVGGALVSGGLTFATFLPMAKKLQRELVGTDFARPATPNAPEAPNGAPEGRVSD